MTKINCLSYYVQPLVVLVILSCLPQWIGSVSQIGYPAIRRQKEDTVRKAIFLPDPSLEVQHGGILTGWNIYTVPHRRFQRIHLQIWRPNDKITGRRRLYKLVSDIEYHNDVPGLGQISLHPEDRIKLFPHDTIGFYSPGINSVPWDSVSCNDGNVHFFKYNPYKLRLGSEYPFETADVSWDPCRHYSINATVMLQDEIDRLDELADHGAYLYSKKPYGYNQFERDTSDATSIFVSKSHIFHAMCTFIFVVWWWNSL